MKVTSTISRAEPVPLPANIPSVQPGGGLCCRAELAWGRLRRRYLRRFRPGYVRRMAGLRRGDPVGCPHEILDPRDLKFCRNHCDCRWDSGDDPFRWRERIPFARWGLAELVLAGVPLAVVTAVLVIVIWPLALPPAIVLAWLAWFFRDPPRVVPTEPGVLVSPADGRIIEITRLAHDDFVGGPAVRIGIFLSIFNVHVNRSPAAARVIELYYSPGRFHSALAPESALENENMWIGLEEVAPPHRRLAVRQIAGAIARRIVCDLRPGEELERGRKFGMIKFGSRTELVLADDGSLGLRAAVGDRVEAGRTVLAEYKP